MIICELAKHLAANEKWDFFMMVEMGPDRMHHGFWRYFDKEHRLYEPGHPLEHAIRDYYVFMDKLVGELLAEVGDETYVMIVSDHGVKGMSGGICVNDWLIDNGFLTLKEKPMGQIPLQADMIDWSKTVAWGEGGYYGRIFMNVDGREPKGIVPRADYDKVRGQLREAFEAIADDKGVNIGTRALFGEDIYKVARNVAPDLFVYFGDLNWRSVGKVGNESIHVFANDTGPDDANHDYQGIFILSDNSGQSVKRDDLKIYDVAPTILSLLDLKVPADMIGRAVIPAKAGI
ncbi:MAG TPA: hypothetical protein ENI11_02785 [Actinobacteria bacterium]|nr:hypothetical protein [Actinomycetota bacterium]